MRTLSNSEATIIIGLLVEQLGGEAVLTREDIVRVDDLEVVSEFNPATLKTSIRARRKPPTLQGEIVTAEPQSIEPPTCPHKFERLAWNFDGDLRCQDCGVTVGHDEDMRVRSINGRMNL
jgi:hypothetical protein